MNRTGTIEEQAAWEGSFARTARKRVRCTITGKAAGDLGSKMCGCVGCTVWRSREASVLKVETKQESTR